MFEIIGDILERIAIIIMVVFIIISITDLCERMNNIEAQLQILVEMEVVEE